MEIASCREVIKSAQQLLASSNNQNTYWQTVERGSFW